MLFVSTSLTHTRTHAHIVWMSVSFWEEATHLHLSSFCFSWLNTGLLSSAWVLRRRQNICPPAHPTAKEGTKQMNGKRETGEKRGVWKEIGDRSLLLLCLYLNRLYDWPCYPNCVAFGLFLSFARRISFTFVLLGRVRQTLAQRILDMEGIKHTRVWGSRKITNRGVASCAAVLQWSGLFWFQDSKWLTATYVLFLG